MLKHGYWDYRQVTSWGNLNWWFFRPIWHTSHSVSAGTNEVTKSRCPNINMPQSADVRHQQPLPKYEYTTICRCFTLYTSEIPFPKTWWCYISRRNIRALLQVVETARTFCNMLLFQWPMVASGWFYGAWFVLRLWTTHMIGWLIVYAGLSRRWRHISRNNGVTIETENSTYSYPGFVSSE